MNGGICVCVLLAALSTSCLGDPSSSTQEENRAAQLQLDTALSEHARHARSTPLSSQLKPLTKPEEATDPRTSLSELLTRLLSRKGTFRRNMNSRASGLSANHRIKDRDYLGWMDFGRRSAEEYEYSS
ncbi:cholecystokinin a [Megalops cyprinoides]|uniref:cholecystokinin a n=1 Tax=Megalops cyprinoides TaxID=118141 RepID=UPI001864F24C|nr:cholecystokinin a [Megalops cyprinoides]